MRCDETKALINSAADNELSTSEAALVSEHLNRCLDCTDEWEQVLKVRSTLREIIKNNQPSSTFEKNLLFTIDKEIRLTRNQSVQHLLGKFAASFLLIVALGFGMFFYSQTQEARASVDVKQLVAGIGHHSDAPEDHAFIVSYMGRGAEHLSQKIGFKYKDSSLKTFTLYGADKVSVSQNKPFLRLCYSNEEHSNCIDCYQAPHGLLTLASSENQFINGKQVRIARIGNQSIVMINQQDLDVVYASALSQEELLKLVRPNV